MPPQLLGSWCDSPPGCKFLDITAPGFKFSKCFKILKKLYIFKRLFKLHFFPADGWCGNMHQVSISVSGATGIDIFAWPILLMTVEKHALTATSPQRPASKNPAVLLHSTLYNPVSASFVLVLNPFLMTTVSLAQQEMSAAFKEGKGQGFLSWVTGTDPQLLRGDKDLCFGRTSQLQQQKYT